MRLALREFLQNRTTMASEGNEIVLTVRPRVAELVFQLYGRSLHPELFEVCSSLTLQRGEYEARIDITSSGHVITWRYDGLTLTEVSTSAQHPLPERRRLMSHVLCGQRSDGVECRGRVSYQTTFQLEHVSAEVLWGYHECLRVDALRNGLFHQFSGGGRISLGAISYINVEPRNRALRVHTFHTFPDECAIVQSRSVFQLP